MDTPDAVGRENCKVPGNVHKARNCGVIGCSTTGFCQNKVTPIVRSEIPVHCAPCAGSCSVPVEDTSIPTEKQLGPHTVSVRIVRDFKPEVSHGGSTTMLPTDKDARKGMPITTGVLDYFPLAMAEIARVSKAGNDQHNPGQPLHWARGKSKDHADALARHLLERGKLDTDGQRHSGKLAWRALALLQEELEAEQDKGSA